MDENKYIKIRGAREHNLKNIDIDIPRRKMVVLTGLSGSGKSSLAFDTIYAEGQRRYVESLSSYARMFLGQLEKPDLDSIEGLVSCDLYRPEIHSQQPQIHCRHRYRDIRLFQTSLCQSRTAFLPELRQEDQVHGHRPDNR